jgi:Rieske Fe-S protein
MRARESLFLQQKDVKTMERMCGRSCPVSAGAGQLQAPVEIGRREFVTYAGAAFAALALAACSVGDAMMSPTTIASTPLNLSDLPALANVGGVATTVVSGVPLAIVRTGTSTFLAFSRICPHQGSTINVSSNGFICPNHGATFNTLGKWTGGQRTSNLTSYPVSYDASTGALTIGS